MIADCDKIDTNLKHIERIEQVENCLRIFYKDKTVTDLEIKIL